MIKTLKKLFQLPQRLKKLEEDQEKAQNLLNVLVHELFLQSRDQWSAIHSILTNENIYPIMEMDNDNKFFNPINGTETGRKRLAGFIVFPKNLSNDNIFCNNEPIKRAEKIILLDGYSENEDEIFFYEKEGCFGFFKDHE